MWQDDSLSTKRKGASPGRSSNESRAYARRLGFHHLPAFLYAFTGKHGLDALHVIKFNADVPVFIRQHLLIFHRLE